MQETDLIKDRLDIVALVGEYVVLKPAGANWKGLCPFHGEKTPSFMVNREKQIFHCFGCAKGGDVFTFLQEMEGMEFPEALRVLAERAGVTLTTRTAISKEKGEQRSRLRELLSLAGLFFHKVLSETAAGEPARAYLAHRGVHAQTIDRFHIGFIPDGAWSALTDFLTKKKGFGVEECVAAGLTRRHERGTYYDVFRGRVMFPLWDVHGSIVGFTGRLLEEKEGVGKYVNTPDTELFDKSAMVYALHVAKQAAKEAGYFVVVEGQMDVIACHQAGMQNVVAASGTALTQRHVDILKRYVNQLRMAFDADAAGERAAKRGIDLAVAAGMDVRMITIPDGAGKDPDECIQKDHAVWARAVADAQPVFAYYISRYVTPQVHTDPEQLRSVSELLCRELARVSDPIVSDFWTQKVSFALGASMEAVRTKIRQLQREERRDQSKNPRAPTAAPVQRPVPKNRWQHLAQHVLCLMVHDPALFGKKPVPVEYFPADAQTLYSAVVARYTTPTDRTGSLTPSLPAHGPALTHSIAALELLATEEFFEFTPDARAQEYMSAIGSLKEEWLKAQRTHLTDAIRQAEQRGDGEAAAALSAAYQDLARDV